VIDCCDVVLTKDGISLCIPMTCILSFYLCMFSLVYNQLLLYISFIGGVQIGLHDAFGQQ
jgi:uncharacterized YccA/Bax inhibitor family protein